MPAPRGRGAQGKLDFAEMAPARQLPVEDPGFLHAVGNGFPIDHLGAARMHVGVELPFQAVDDDLQVQLPHAGQQGLARVFVGVDLEAGVFLADPLQGRPQALLVVPGHRLDGQGDHRHVGRYGFQHDGVLAAAQGIAGGSGLQAQEGDDIAGVGFLQGFPLVGMHAQDAGHLLRGLLDGIVDFLAEFQGAGIDAHIGEPLALVHHDLEGQGGQRLVIFGRAALRLPGLGVLAHNRRHLGGIGQKILDALQQRLDALVAQGGAAVGGHPFESQGGPLDAGLEGLHRQGLLRQVDLHHLVVHFRHGLHQGLPGRGGLVLIVGGDLQFLKSPRPGFLPATGWPSGSAGR